MDRRRFSILLNFIRAELERCVNWQMATVAFIGVVASVTGLFERHHRLGGLELLDGRGWYTPEDAAALFGALDRLDADARLVYAATGLTIDMAFPIAYGLLFAILLFRLSQVPLHLLPIALAVLDILENLTVAALALSYAGSPSPVAWLAGVFTLIKTALVYATLLAVLGAATHWIWIRLKW